jgi:hypothetical protein
VVDFNEIIGLITVIITVIIYAVYIRDAYTNKIKPHPFSWFLFLIITATIFLAQLSDGAGPGAWMNGVLTFFNFIIFFLSLRNKSDVIKKLDYFILALAILSIVLWVMTSTPLYSVVLLSVAVTLAFIPTIFKIYDNPFEESASLFTVGIFRHGLTILAMDNVSLITSLTPFILVFENIIIALFIFWRRRQVKP